MITWRSIFVARTVMFAINFIVILFMSIIIYNTTGLICEYDMARSFIERIKYVPTIPWKVPAYTIILLLLLFLSVILREKKFRDNQPVLYMFCILDIVICSAVMFCLNMGYKGILLIAIANIVLYINGSKRRSLFIIAVIFVYILLDYDIISIKTNMFSINDYVQYYSSIQRVYIYGVRNVLTSINEIVFILFMILVIQSKIDENEKTKELYSKLFKTAEELKVVNIQLQDYARKSEEMAKIKERNRLAREIHDTIGHTLTGIATGLDACIDLIDINLERAKKQLVKITELSRKGLVDVRRSVSELRPDALERFSIVQAIQKLTEDINDCTRTKVNVNVAGEVSILAADEEETTYRIVQEGITNAVRHGNATEINVSIEFKKEAVFIQIIDNGIGCENPKAGFGLKHIKERVQMLKGKVRFESKSGEGFNIIADIPIRGKDE